jgi:hypothetical protein
VLRQLLQTVETFETLAKAVRRITTCGQPGGTAATIAHCTAPLRIPAKPITDSDLMAITIPNDADRLRSEGTLSYFYHAEVIAILSILLLYQLNLS